MLVPRKIMEVKLCFFFFKQKTAYEVRISDWSDVCSSDLGVAPVAATTFAALFSSGRHAETNRTASRTATLRRPAAKAAFRHVVRNCPCRINPVPHPLEARPDAASAQCASLPKNTVARQPLNSEPRRKRAQPSDAFRYILGKAEKRRVGKK